MYHKIIQLFLRLALATGFLSAVADRLGMWPKAVAAWGDYDTFLVYTARLNPWLPEAFLPLLGGVATAAEVVLALWLLIGWKTKLAANLSGILLLLFALSMSCSTGMKTAFDASVYSAAAAAFALALMKGRFWSVDGLKEA